MGHFQGDLLAIDLHRVRELAYLQDGLSSVTIGDPTNGTGTVDIDTATLNDPVTVVGLRTAFGDLVNGDFSDPADPTFGWTLSGAEEESGRIVFREEPPTTPAPMTLSQSVELGPGDYILSYFVSFYSSGRGETDFFKVEWGSEQLFSLALSEKMCRWFLLTGCKRSQNTRRTRTGGHWIEA